MGYLTLKSEYSFKESYGFLERLVNEYSDDGFIGICDNNTFAVHRLRELCNKHNNNVKDYRDHDKTKVNKQGQKVSSAKHIKPIFGLRINVVKDATKKVNEEHPTITMKMRGQFGVEYIIIAKNKIGLREIFNLTSINSANFYYRPNVSSFDINNLSNNVVVIANSKIITDRVDYIGLNLYNRSNYLNKDKTIKHEFKDKLFVVTDNNFYPTKEDEVIYELMAGRNKDSKTFSQHILTDKEKSFYFPDIAIKNIKTIADLCEDYQLDKAKPVKSIKGESLDRLVMEGAKKKGIDLSKEPYKSRIIRELDVIKQKKFDEYFLVVGDIIRWAKERMLLAPGRGSSAGSLVCHCLDITDIDPIKHRLFFERFIDMNRFGEPDIDSDFPDVKRDKVVKYIEKTYGIDKVKTISNLTTYKPKSAIGDFAKELKIPEWEVESAKDAIIERAGGDNRASFCIEDTFTETDAGKTLIEKYPEIGLTKFIEGHSKNKGKHAAGVIVCNKPLTYYCGVDNRDSTVYLNKNDAEDLGLLKVDILGLRTLSVLEGTAELAKFDFNDFYSLDLEDKKVYNIFKEQRLTGIFQFEGSTMQSLNKDIPMECFEDIVAAGSLARPGALSSGGTQRYIDIKNGKREPIYYCDLHKEITSYTHGICVYQEQMMQMSREISGFSWKDVSTLRRAASKSYGDEFFNQFKEPFIKGCIKNSKLDEETALAMWKDVASSGSYSFNRSHSVAYGMISFWTAWCKTYYPLEFIASMLNHSKSDSDSLKTLREFYENDGLEYEAAHPDLSDVKWSIQYSLEKDENGEDKFDYEKMEYVRTNEKILVGGLTNINGFGVNKAKKAIKMRKNEIPFTPSIYNSMSNPVTPFDILYPCNFHWYKIYNNPIEFTGDNKPISLIKDIQKKGDYWLIGLVKYFDDINLNDYVHVEKRGNVLEDNWMKVHVKLEDDTDVITVIIPRQEYSRLSSVVLNSKIDKTWLIVRGKIIFDDARIFIAEDIANLNDQIGLEIYDPDFSKIKR